MAGLAGAMLTPISIGEGTLPYNPNVKRLTTQEIEDIGKPFGDSKDWVPTVEDPATDFYKPNSLYNKNRNGNKNYFPQGNGSEFAKWILRITAGSALYKKFWYDPQHPDSK